MNKSKNMYLKNSYKIINNWLKKRGILSIIQKDIKYHALILSFVELLSIILYKYRRKK
jgi:hypothetical protein